MVKLIYQLLPRLWGSGKFSAIDSESLDYFRGLGVDSIWYTGIVRHATKWGDNPEKVVKGDAGSPYAITDCFDVNPYLADDPSRRMEEFENLVSRTHAAGLKVITDFVPNHVARECRGFGGNDDVSVHWSPENDFFYYPGEELKLPVDIPEYHEFPAKASGNAFTPAPGINDWWETVKLNYCDFHTATWDKMLDVLLFWASKGVDGFRCDMVELVPPEFFRWAIGEVKKIHPDIVFIAEVYQKDKYRQYVKDVGFDYLYDKCGLYDVLRAVTCSNASAREISRNWQFLGDLQPSMLNFLENHDEQRIASDFFCGSPEKGYAALAVSLLLNTAPFLVYFGQECGERGMQAEGFSGLDGRTSIFDWCKVPSLESPEESVLKRYRDVLLLSRTEAFLSGRTFDLNYCQEAPFNPDRQFAWLRSGGGKTWLLVSNFSGEAAEVSVKIPKEALDYLEIKPISTVYTLSVKGSDYSIEEVL